MVETIAGPARLVGLPVQAGLPEQLVDEVAGEPGASGSLGAALLTRMYDLGWAKRSEGARIVAFTKRGEEYVNAAFPLWRRGVWSVRGRRRRGAASILGDRS